jgi:hypothetical protein
MYREMGRGCLTWRTNHAGAPNMQSVQWKWVYLSNNTGRRFFFEEVIQSHLLKKYTQIHFSISDAERQAPVRVLRFVLERRRFYSPVVNATLIMKNRGFLS